MKSEELDLFTVVFITLTAAVILLILGYIVGYSAGKEAGVGICYKAQVAK